MMKVSGYALARSFYHAAARNFKGRPGDYDASNKPAIPSRIGLLYNDFMFWKDAELRG